VPSTDTASLVDLGRRAKAAGRLVAGSSSAVRDDALRFAADLIDERTDRILTANAADVTRATPVG
jgi:gamma-glutamyl phosphate reductase